MFWDVGWDVFCKERAAKRMGILSFAGGLSFVSFVCRRMRWRETKYISKVETESLLVLVRYFFIIFSFNINLISNFMVYQFLLVDLEVTFFQSIDDGY